MIAEKVKMGVIQSKIYSTTSQSTFNPRKWSAEPIQGNNSISFSIIIFLTRHRMSITVEIFRIFHVTKKPLLPIQCFFLHQMQFILANDFFVIDLY